MPVKVTDDDLSAVVTTTGGRVLSTKSTVQIVVGNPVSIHGVAIGLPSNVWLQISLSWNGGENPPTVIRTEPTSYWGLTGELDNNFSVYWDMGSNGWIIKWSYTSFIPLPPVLLNIDGAFDNVLNTGFTEGGPALDRYQMWGFQLRLGITPVKPDPNDYCTILITQEPTP